jgi:hypothetical protein
VGAFGQEVFAEGVASVLRYAKRNNIQHIVFTIDSTGGNLDEATAIYRSLEKDDAYFKYHAVIRNCVGDALAVPLWCDTLHLMPGARIGGAQRKLSEISDKIDADEEEVIRSQMAREVAYEAERRGRNGAAIRAMLDPLEVLAAWRDDKGEVAFGPKPPANLPGDRLIFKNDETSVLVLSYEEAAELGLQIFDGKVEDLGKVLGFTSWKQESDFGQRQMRRRAQIEQKRAKAASTAFETRVKQNIQRREITNRSIQHNVRTAAEWNPTNASYSTYAGRWNWRGRYRGSNTWTQASQKQWKDRTDACMTLLSRAAKAARTMKKLDRKAVDLGLEPTYKEGELDDMIKDLQAKYNMLARNRKRTGP